MLLFRAKIPQDWLPKILGNLPEVLIDHAHLERKAATTSISLEKYRELFPQCDRAHWVEMTHQDSNLERFLLEAGRRAPARRD